MSEAFVRQARMELDLAPQRVLLEQMRAHERLSEPFTIEAYVISDTGPVDFLPHLGKPIGFVISNGYSDHLRDFNGLLFEASYKGSDASGYRYQLLMRPWLHLLQQNLTYSIFQNVTALDVIQQIIEKWGFSRDVDYKKLSGKFRKRKYCVQYRESDFNFISRLMEEEGIYYYFEHAHDKHVLTLCNAPGSRVRCEQPFVKFRPPSEVRPDDHDHINIWEETVSTATQNRVRLRTFDFLDPRRPPQATHQINQAHKLDSVEYYDYPAPGFVEDDIRPQTSHIHLAQRADRRLFRGQGTAGQMACGRLFDLQDHDNPHYNRGYMVTALSYAVISENYRSLQGDREPLPNVIEIEAAPSDVAWRPKLVTPRPVARGPETAIVTCPAGEEIYTDQYGRVKVRFHWDLTDPTNETSSCWLRVSHNSAGSGFGNIILPRANQEVIVDFLDGDPDRPIITGRVYNAANMQTYKLDANKTRSVWRSQTVGKINDPASEYDGAEEKPKQPYHNEIYMEDKANTEMFHVYAQRKMETFVRLDDLHRVYRDQTKRVGRDRTVEIKRHETKTVEDGDETHTVKTGKRTTTIKEDETVTVQSGQMAVTVEQKDYTLNAKMGAVKVDAMTQIVLTVGSNSITIDQKGVTINALTISLNASISLSISAPKLDLASSGILTLAAPMVKIN